uniref:FemAB-related protein, PEP-CTERM system-associated n=1 Tax=Geobacter sp. (strain M21) TaxID=443144 RepID=C6DZX1_GEOSM
MPGYRVTQEIDPSRWDAYVDSMPAATSYHLSAWGKIIGESFGHRTHYLAAVDQAGEIAGVLPLVHMKSALFGSFLVSVPFVNYGGLLCRDRGCEKALLREADELRRSCGAEHVELRHLGAGIEGLPSREHKVTMMLALSEDPDAQWANFNAKLRNQIRKAQKSGLSFRTGGVELLDDFYDVFARNMRDLGTPVYGKEFFANVLGSLPRATRIAAVQLQGKVVAAGILSRYKKSMEMPWASSIAEYKTLCPNNLLYWESIRFAIAEGCASFDFGRSTPNEGTYNFKKQWGAEPVQLYWQYLLEKGKALPELNPKNPKFQAAIAVWKRLPVGLTRLIGPAIVRNIP